MIFYKFKHLGLQSKSKQLFVFLTILIIQCMSHAQYVTFATDIIGNVSRSGIFHTGRLSAGAKITVVEGKQESILVNLGKNGNLFRFSNGQVVADPKILIEMSRPVTVYASGGDGTKKVTQIVSDEIPKRIYTERNNPDGIRQTTLSAGEYTNKAGSVDSGYQITYRNNVLTGFDIKAGAKENSLNLSTKDGKNFILDYGYGSNIKTVKIENPQAAIKGEESVKRKIENTSGSYSMQVGYTKFQLAEGNEIININYFSNQKTGKNELILLIKNRNTKRVETVKFQYETNEIYRNNHFTEATTNDGVA